MTEDKLPLTSQDVLTDRISVLSELFPEVFVEGKVDFEQLKLALGEYVDEGRERYGLSWAGKSEAIRNLQAQSVGTLKPVPEESVNFETTENLFIEGDNLEVLKLLQKSYHNQIKMIYIDPPYNTGKEFIYPDNFREGLEDYLRFSGQKNGEGIKLTTNTETSGRIHSNWLSMIYPRLFLARNLLKDDGVIFVSIDDNEIANLRLLMNEIFGAENFICQIIIQSNKRGQTYKEISKTHEYLLLYSKSDFYNLSEISKGNSALPHQDAIGNFELWELRNRNPKFGRYNRPNLYFPIYVSPTIVDSNGFFKISLTKSEDFSIEVFPKNSEGNDSCWRWSKNKIESEGLLGRFPILVAKKKRDNGWNIYEKSRKNTTKVKSIWDETCMISEQGTIQLGDLQMRDYFDHPKPVGLILKILSITTQRDDIVLDFFSGSCTTAHAVLEQNQEDGGNRKFIMVQLPESCDENSEAFKAGYRNIADIGKERIRRAINKINQEENGKLNLNGSVQDRGFKVFKLTESNFKIWDGSVPKDVEQLQLLLQEFTDNIMPGSTKLGMLYEIMLKAGFSLTAKVEKLEIGAQEIYTIENKELFLCLEAEILETTVKQILTHKPKQFTSLDASFRGNDQLKTNTQLQMRDHDIKFRTV